MEDILIGNSTSSDNFYPDMSFCALSSRFSDPTVLMCCKSTAAVFFKLDITRYPFYMTFTLALVAALDPEFSCSSTTRLVTLSN